MKQVEPNFKPSRAEIQKRQRARKRAKQKQRPGNSAEHLAFIRQLPCIDTGSRYMVEPHHLKCLGGRGGAMRAPDRYAVPLCHRSHIYGVETVGSKNELAWFQQRGINPRKLADDLWAATGDLRLMRAVFERHWDAKPRQAKAWAKP